MQHIKNNHYKADNGNFIVRKSDNKIVGEEIFIGFGGSIENYTEQPYTEESYMGFYTSHGMSPDEAKRRWDESHPVNDLGE